MDIEVRLAVLESKHLEHHARINTVEDNYARIMNELLNIQTKMPGLVEVRSWVIWGVSIILGSILLAVVALVLHK